MAAEAPPAVRATLEQAQSFTDGLFSFFDTEMRCLFDYGAVDLIDANRVLQVGRRLERPVRQELVALNMYVSRACAPAPDGTRRRFISVYGPGALTSLQVFSAPPAEEGGAPGPWLIRHISSSGQHIKQHAGVGYATDVLGGEFESPAVGDALASFRGDVAMRAWRPSAQLQDLVQRLCDMTAEEHAEHVANAGAGLA